MEPEYTPQQPDMLSTEVYDFPDDSIRFPDSVDYNALDRLKWIEEEAEQRREEEDLLKELLGHRLSGCAKTHYYRAGDKKKLVCRGCMQTVTRLYGGQYFYQIGKRAA